MSVAGYSRTHSSPTWPARRTVEAINAGHDKPVLPPMRLHDLRHVQATLLLKAGVPMHVVAARPGHADPAITLRVYAHVLRDQAVDVAQIFAPWSTSPSTLTSSCLQTR
jgi:integrase